MPIDRAGLQQHCPTLPAKLLRTDSIQLLNSYLNELIIWNRHINLVGRALKQPQLEEHIYEALNGHIYLTKVRGRRHQLRMADVGSGNGLPGIPLAIIDSALVMTVIERSAKKCAFLRAIRALIAPRGLSIREGDYRECSERFECLVFRALTPLNERRVAEIVPLLNSQGALLAYKGRAQSAAHEAHCLRAYFKHVAQHGVATSPERTMVLAQYPILQNVFKASPSETT